MKLSCKLFFILLNTQLFVQILTVQDLFRYMLPNPAIRDQYNVNLTEVYPCSNSTSYKINANLYQKNITLSKLMIDGKLKLYISFDNSFSINLHTMQWDMIGGWKENSMVLNKKKACSSLRDFLGEAWIPFINSFNKKNYLCPITKSSWIYVDLYNIRLNQTRQQEQCTNIIYQT
ncbi:uncharacterized protein LOC126908168 isoform X2 [Daktulosphaira vitifoliae]|uniref:uncharacterized protein LOC126908168 isoform X2 n=1 Tax=Daktulosphaira vitifoliae TaxID=58002 RepID=UPI0021AA7C96|nr:uncharacterized protein LOC126908168 isoform X2 [Daktulosphaira vitifoliae]